MEFVKSADVVVIGGGIVGTAVLRELSKYDLKCILVEKEPDLAMGTTKANSAILHAGFDAPTGSLKAITNVRGNQLYHELEKDLDLDIKWTGSMVAATTDEEMATLQELLERGKANGVEGLKILSHEEVLQKEKKSYCCKRRFMGSQCRCLLAFWCGIGLCQMRCAKWGRSNS